MRTPLSLALLLPLTLFPALAQTPGAPPVTSLGDLKVVSSVAVNTTPILSGCGARGGPPASTRPPSSPL